MLSFPIPFCLTLSYMDWLRIISKISLVTELTLSLSLWDRVDGPVAGAGADGGQTARVHQAEGNSAGNYSGQ